MGWKPARKSRRRVREARRPGRMPAPALAVPLVNRDVSAPLLVVRKAVRRRIPNAAANAARARASPAVAARTRPAKAHAQGVIAVRAQPVRAMMARVRTAHAPMIHDPTIHDPVARVRVAHARTVSVMAAHVHRARRSSANCPMVCPQMIE